MKHVWQTKFDPDSKGWFIDSFATESPYPEDWHNGPVCVVCDQGFCEHCTRGIYDQECPGRDWWKTEVGDHAPDR